MAGAVGPGVGWRAPACGGCLEELEWNEAAQEAEPCGCLSGAAGQGVLRPGVAAPCSFVTVGLHKVTSSASGAGESQLGVDVVFHPQAKLKPPKNLLKKKPAPAAKPPLISCPKLLCPSIPPPSSTKTRRSSGRACPGRAGMPPSPPQHSPLAPGTAPWQCAVTNRPKPTCLKQAE